MAEDRIDIVVQDKGADKAATNIRRIGTEAEKSDAWVTRLKLNLASVNSGAASRLAAASNANSTAMLKEAMAQERLSQAKARTALVEQQLATETAKTAAATANAERAALRLAAAQGAVAKNATQATAALETESAAQARIAAMVDASLAKQAAGPASAGTGRNLGGPVGSRSVAAAQAEMMAAASAAPAATKAIQETEAAAASLSSKGPGYFAAFRAGAVGAFDTIRDFVTGNGSRFRSVASEVEGGIGAVGAAAAKATPHVKGSSTAIRELLVIAREGGRGDFTRMAGSVSILATALGLLRVVFPVAIAGAVAFGLAKIALNTDKEKESLTKYAESLGTTTKEMRKFKDETVNASGKLKEHNNLQITFGDIAMGVWQTAKEGVAELGQQLGITGGDVQNFTQQAISYLKDFLANAIGGVYAFGKFVYTEVSNLFTLAYNVGRVTGNAIHILYAKLANAVIMIWNGVGAIANKVSRALGQGDVIEKMDYLNSSVGNIGNGLKSFKGEDFFGDMRKGADATNRVLGRMGKNIDAAARARIKAEHDAMVAHRTTPKGRTPGDPKTQADYLADENKKLDDQLRRMNMLKDAREIQEKLDEVEEAFIKRRMPLDKAQLEQFRAKFVAIQQGQRQQAEMDRIYGESTDALQHYNAVVGAANELLRQHAVSQVEAAAAINQAKREVEASKDLIGANAALRTYEEALDKIAVSLDRKGISEAQAAQQTVIATRAYKEATDPLFSLNEELNTATVTAGLYGDALQQQTTYERIRQAYLAKGIELDATWTKGQNAAVDAIMNRTAALQQQQYVQSQLGGVLDPILDAQKQIKAQADVYAELQRLRDQDVINEAAYQQAKHALWVKYNEQKLDATAQFFGTLAQITAKGHGVVGAISKAAAVAEAIIQGFVAAQKALASAPPPFNFIAAAAVGLQTGANIAGILSTNVGSYKDGGSFIVQGRSGVDANNINMNVTKGERVTIETVKQQRANDNQRVGPAPDVQVPIKIVNLQSKQEILDHMASDEGERVILNVLSNNPSTVRSVAGTK